MSIAGYENFARSINPVIAVLELVVPQLIACCSACFPFSLGAGGGGFPEPALCKKANRVVDLAQMYISDPQILVTRGPKPKT
jgi:hypothetical protein